MRRLLALVLAMMLCAPPSSAWVPQLTRPSTGGAPQVDRWDFTSFPVRWSLNPATNSNVHGSRSAEEVILASFDTWMSAPNTALSVTRGNNSSVTSSNNSPSDINLICFVCADADFSSDTTLAITISTTSNNVGEADFHGGATRFVGQILKSDIIFNPAVEFTTDGTGGGENLQAVAVHEIGHFFGLDHTGVVRGVMFPAASDAVLLSYDDWAGIATTYPAGSSTIATGAVSGTVSLGGSGVFGAHVFADSTTDALPLPINIRKSPISTLTRTDGSYTLSGVPPDTYTVTAEPLDDPVNNDDVDWASAFGRGSVQTSFTTRSH